VPAGAPVLPAWPGQEVLIDEVTPQRRVVGVQRAKERADPLLWVAQARLECLGDVLEHQAPPGLFGRYGLDPVLDEEYPQPWIASQRAEDSRRIKIGHNPIVG
jgi:hypothetical protein